MDAISPNFTKANVMKIVEKLSSKSFQSFLQMITDLLIEESDDENDYVNNWNKFIKIFGDIAFTCPDYVFINNYSSFGGKVYYYRFESKPSIAEWSPKWVKGALHSDEIIYIFGFPLIAENMFRPEEIELSKSMIRAWTQFANNGSVMLQKYH
jgi:carboxylesterase type B